ncbi:hypothetical protein HPP92_021153 [Vanilla planifolia]|uniref:Protein PLANT CADMIUM RESISTANCE 8 n=1 Tax=Vanilla planifolia TaxID=51239 RepID=A0A835Q492_VANPL|nr:hypothetical protein HPP92_021153 [Vanilla planifolia]
MLTITIFCAMEEPRHSDNSWPTSLESSSEEQEQDLHRMQPGVPTGVSSSPLNSHTPQSTARTAASTSSDGYPSKFQLPSPPGRRERMAQIGRPWTSTIYDCGQHQTNAIMTAFFPCVTFGQIAEIIDEGQTSCTMGSFMYLLMVPALCSCWMLGSFYRRKLRYKYKLVQAPAEDWSLHLFCPLCSLCQEFRELRNRGVDPSIGWMGYLAQQHEESLTTPPKNQTMSF